MVLIELPTSAVAQTLEHLAGALSSQRESARRIPSASVIHAATLANAQPSRSLDFAAQARRCC